MFSDPEKQTIASKPIMYPIMPKLRSCRTTLTLPTYSLACVDFSSHSKLPISQQHRLQLMTAYNVPERAEVFPSQQNEPW